MISLRWEKSLFSRKIDVTSLFFSEKSFEKSSMMLEKRTSLFNRIIIGYLINVCLSISSSSQANASVVVDYCSKWNISSPTFIFGRSNQTAANATSTLNLSHSTDLDIVRETGEIVLLDDNNHRVLVINLSNTSAFFAILSDSSNLTNRSMVINSPSAISHNPNKSIYILDNWDKQFIQIPCPREYGENATLTNKSLPSAFAPGQNNDMHRLCVDPTDESIFISSRFENNVLRFNADLLMNGTYIGSGLSGNTSTQLSSPRSIVMNNNRTL